MSRMLKYILYSLDTSMLDKIKLQFWVPVGYMG